MKQVLQHIIIVEYKLAHIRDGWSILHNWRFCQLQSHVTQKLGRISKIRPDQIYILWPSLRICGQLPTSIVNGIENRFWKWPDFQLWRAREFDPWPWIRSYCIPLCVTHWPLPKCRFHWNRINFLWTDGRTHGHLRAAIRSTLWKSRPKNKLSAHFCMQFDNKVSFQRQIITVFKNWQQKIILYSFVCKPMDKVKIDRKTHIIMIIMHINEMAVHDHHNGTYDVTENEYDN